MRVSTSEGEQIFNEFGHAARLAHNLAQHFCQLFARTFAAKGDIAGSDDECQWGAEFVRGVGCKSLDGTKPGLDARKHGVEGSCQAGKLIFSGGNLETRGEVGRIDCFGLVSDLLDRSEGAAAAEIA